MGIFDFLKKSNKTGYADSSSIPAEEKQFYQPDEYYTLYSFPGTQFQKRVITFEERKKSSYPSAGGLYVAEILLLHYCSLGKYPNPSNGYPGFWWFEYGIRDVGARLRDLERRGLLLMQQGKYQLTDKGKRELSDNSYIPYIYGSRKKTIENTPFGAAEFNVWSINKLIHDNPGTDYNKLVQQAEKRVTSELDIGIDAEASGDIEKAIAFYEKQVSEKFDGSHPYDRLAVIYRKRKEYDKEIDVLKKAITVFSKENRLKACDGPKKLQAFKDRLGKAQELKQKYDKQQPAQ